MSIVLLDVRANLKQFYQRFMTQHNSPFEGFSKLSFEERQKRLKQIAKLTDEDLDILSGSKGLTLDQAEHLIENVIGVFALPIGLATNFKIDGRDLAVPMVVEETSIIAACSASAKWIRKNGGFKTKTLGNLIIGQIQFPFLKDVFYFVEKITESSEQLTDLANEVVPNLKIRGGGVVGLQIRTLKRPDGGTMAVLHVLCDPCDAMGANLINQVCEALKPEIERITKEKVGLCILSNLVDTKLVEATCEIHDISESLGNAIAEATLFANLDEYRCATHNKGVMNGIDPVLIATGNDWRAVEAAMHAYATTPKAAENFLGQGSLENRNYRSITEWKYEHGILKGRLCAPIAVGTVGGVTKIHPAAKLALKIMGVTHAEELARIVACTGLAQNLSALRALCSEGIVKGHMRLHAANLAIMAGANKEEVCHIQEKLKEEEHISLKRAKEILTQIRTQNLNIQ